MSIFAAVRYTLSLAADAAEAIVFGPNCNQAADRLWTEAGRARSGAERLAETEAEEESSEPGFNPRWNMTGPGSWVLPDYDIERDLALHEHQPFAPVSPRSTGFLSLPTDVDQLPESAVLNRLDHQTALLEDIRNILQHNNDGRGHGKDVGQRAEWPSGAKAWPCPTSPSQDSAVPGSFSSSSPGGHIPPGSTGYPGLNGLNPQNSSVRGGLSAGGNYFTASAEPVPPLGPERAEGPGSRTDDSASVGDPGHPACTCPFPQMGHPIIFDPDK